MLRVSDLNCFTVGNLLLARFQAFADTRFAATRSTRAAAAAAAASRGKCLPSSSVNIPLTQTEEREIYEIHMFNTFHFVPGDLYCLPQYFRVETFCVVTARIV